MILRIIWFLFKYPIRLIWALIIIIIIIIIGTLVVLFDYNKPFGPLKSLISKKDWTINSDIDPEFNWIIFNEKGRWSSIFHWALGIKN